MTDVLSGPWATPDDVPTARFKQLAEIKDLDLAAYLEQASEILFLLSGSRWAGTGAQETVTLRSWPPQAGQGSWPYESTWGSCGCWNYGSLMDNWLFPPINQFVGTHLAPKAIKLPHKEIALMLSRKFENAISSTSTETVPDSIFDRSRMSLIRCSRSDPEELIFRENSTCFSLKLPAEFSVSC